jgi:hypothetical protein
MHKTSVTISSAVAIGLLAMAVLMPCYGCALGIGGIVLMLVIPMSSLLTHDKSQKEEIFLESILCLVGMLGLLPMFLFAAHFLK